MRIETNPVMTTGVSSIYLGYGNWSEFWEVSRALGVGGTAKRLDAMDVRLRSLRSDL